MGQYRALFISIVILGIFFLIIKTLGQNFSGVKTREVYFSDFLNEAAQNNITSAEIQGNLITARTKDGTELITLGPSKPDYVDLLIERGIQVNVLESANGGGNASKLFSISKSKAKKINPEDNTDSFADVAGIDEAKQDLHEIIDFLREPDRYIKLGGRVPRGILMIGPPGNGKTLLAKAVAGEAKVNFFSISGSDFVEMFVGVGAGRVRDLFEEARAAGPAIIFIDEIDAVGRHRGAGRGGGHDEREQTLNQMLVEMDGFDRSSSVIVIAATNRMDILDPALLRPGRFDRHVYVNLPDIKGRLEILKVYAAKVSMAKDVDLEIIARGTPGFSGAELSNLINEGALYAARTNSKEITLEHLEWARDKIMMGAERKSVLMRDEDRRITAYHEAGHALVSAFLKKTDPLHKITIIPRGNALGVTSFLPENDKTSMDKEELTNNMIISMGGRAAEEIVFEDITTGAEGDLSYCTQMAFRMVTRWGMNERLGALTVEHDHDGKFLPMEYHKSRQASERTLQEVDQETRKLLKHCYEQAKRIITENTDKLHKVADALLEKETISADEFKTIIATV
ncbi:hypothetical protein CHS0354_026806 [Potamilus streckersoni]|uniref:AAA+ ATPase domain-containing protein n=1 Tax=Potamilus streckersoni TaxID=2493646 RepID=A0AAE0W866_9BIVA|nr:hypothetical protein CHS0354_026806 [Potamilus streckersoni]